MASANESGYYGVYERLAQVGEAESEALRSSGAQIGALLTVELSTNEKGDPLATVSSERAGRLGSLSPQVASHLHLLAGRGWEFVCTLSYIWFESSSGMLAAEVGVIAFAPEHAEAMRTYTAGLFERVARGEHPSMRLEPEELAQVLATNGTWNDVKATKPPTFKKGSGSVAYQKQRTFAQYLRDAALEGRMGCKIGTVAFYVVLAALIVLAIVHFVG